MKKRLKQIKKEALEAKEKDKKWRRVVVKQVRDIIVEDWGGEPEMWNEEFEACQAHRALNVLERIYGEDND